MELKLVNNKKNHGIMSWSLFDILMTILLLFPFSSILQNYFNALNIILVGISFVLLCFILISRKLTIWELFIFIYAVLSIVMNCIVCRLDFYNLNMPFYFPFFLLYFLLFVKEKNRVLNYIKKQKKFINYILIIWSLLVGFSFVLPSSYAYEGASIGFVSFTLSTFRLCPIAIYVLSLALIQYVLYKDKRYLLLMIVPALSVLFGSTRTYLGVLVLTFMMIFFILIKNKKAYFIYLIPILVLFMLVIYISPIWDKFVYAFDAGDKFDDFIYGFTSGRSEFWEYDIKSIFSNDLEKIFFGNGVNYLFVLNKKAFSSPLWAHNDYIQILSDYGILGLMIYIIMIFYMLSNIFKNKKIHIFQILLLILIWAFNAFFNMFYTYFCAMLSYPYLCMALSLEEKNKNLQNKEVN